jgi:RimJ/RimL family protein N-acetyltransferase
MEIAIRKFKESDAKEFHIAVLESVEHVSEWLPWCTPAYSFQNAIDWTASAEKVWEAGTDYRFIIEDRETKKILGTIGINQIDPQHKIGNMGYWIRKSAANKGVCTKAGHLVAKYAFSELGFQRIEVHVHKENVASNSVASKLGGKYEGVFRNKLFFKGQAVPAKCYSIIPSDYET